MSELLAINIFKNLPSMEERMGLSRDHVIISRELFDMANVFLMRNNVTVTNLMTGEMDKPQEEVFGQLMKAAPAIDWENEQAVHSLQERNRNQFNAIQNLEQELKCRMDDKSTMQKVICEKDELLTSAKREIDKLNEEMEQRQSNLKEFLKRMENNVITKITNKDITSPYFVDGVKSAIKDIREAFID